MESRTSDGYAWASSAGLQQGGFACDGVINPPRNLKAPPGHVYDVVIVGGGYAGLSAARDLTVAGASIPCIFPGRRSLSILADTLR